MMRWTIGIGAQYREYKAVADKSFPEPPKTLRELCSMITIAILENGEALLDEVELTRDVTLIFEEE